MRTLSIILAATVLGTGLAACTDPTTATPGGTTPETPTATGPLAITAAAFVNRTEDKVGTGGSTAPNGNPDGKISVTLTAGDETVIESIVLKQLGANIPPVGYAVRFTSRNDGSGNWVLGVFNADGTAVNTGYADTLTTLKGEKQFDLYGEGISSDAAKAPFFAPGTRYEVIVTPKSGDPVRRELSVN